MKKLFILFAICISLVRFETAMAQLTLKVNIAAQPIWGPVGYDHVEYYYLPDIDTYYYVPERIYIYIEGGRWISGPYLPQRNSKFDLYNSRKVVINKPNPYLNDTEYKVKYASGSERSREQSIRDSQDSKYFVNRNHPEHSKWKESQTNPGQEKGRKNN
jgi:hypothetical protein